jgi:hypothetical protein
MEEAQALGHSVEDIQAAVARQTQPGPPPPIVVVDSDPELARILAAEITAALGPKADFAGCAEAARLATGLSIVAQSGQAEHVARAIGDRPFRIIHLKSMQDVVAGQKRPPFAILIGVASRSPSIRGWAGTLLSSLGFDATSALIRDPAEPDWQDGLASCQILATDIVAAEDFPERLRPIVVRLISDESLIELRHFVTA